MDETQSPQTVSVSPLFIAAPQVIQEKWTWIQIRKDGAITMEEHVRVMNIILGAVFSVRALKWDQ